MFRAGFRVRLETPEDGRRTHQLKHQEYINKNEDNSPNTLNDKITKNIPVNVSLGQPKSASSQRSYERDFQACNMNE